MRFLKILYLFQIFLVLFSSISPIVDPVASLIMEGSNQPLQVIFFRAHGCAYCEEAAAYLRQLQEIYPSLEIRDFDVYLDSDARTVYNQMLAYLGRSPQGMPTIIIGKQVWVGFQEGYKQEIENALNTCMLNDCPDILAEMNSKKSDVKQEIETLESSPVSITIPILGKVSLQSTSLILSTLIIGFVDGFNPCSLWMLTVLLSLSLYMRSRSKTFLFGLTFIISSSLIYALFIHGLFTALLYLKYHIYIQLLVSIVALIFAVINIKDYFFFKQSPSLSISDQAKPDMYQRMRKLISTEKSGIPLLLGTVALSAGVSLMEFSCTGGFPHSVG